MSELNIFQIDCEKALLSLFGKAIEQREVRGQNERYVTGLLPGTRLRVFIYLDGAEISGENVDCRLERPDYSSLEELRKSFVSKAWELWNRVV